MSAAVVVEQPMDPPGRRLAATSPTRGPLPLAGARHIEGPASRPLARPLPSRAPAGSPRPDVSDRGTEELDLAALMRSEWTAAPPHSASLAPAGTWSRGAVRPRHAPEPGTPTVSGMPPVPGRPGPAWGHERWSGSPRPLIGAGRGPRASDRLDGAAPSTRRGDEGSVELMRLGLHLLVAALPLLAISAHVFGVLTMNRSAGLLVIPLAALAVGLCVLRPLRSDRLVVEGLLWGLLATVLYDAFRLDTVYLLGWWGDFIPDLGTWILHLDPRDRGTGAVAGYVWRYLGDGGGIGMTFFVAAAATGLRRLGRTATMAAAVAFAVFPVWAGLIATVGLSGRGQTLMFRLTPTTIALSLIGHLIFGVVLGIGTWRAKHLESAWPWTPLVDRARLRHHPCFGPWTTLTAHPRREGPPRTIATAVGSPR